MTPDIPTRLRTARKAAGLTQQQLAERLGVRQSRVSEWERGDHEPGASIYVRWIKICRGVDGGTGGEGE